MSYVGWSVAVVVIVFAPLLIGLASIEVILYRRRRKPR